MNPCQLVQRFSKFLDCGAGQGPVSRKKHCISRIGVYLCANKLLAVLGKNGPNIVSLASND